MSSPPKDDDRTSLAPPPASIPPAPARRSTAPPPVVPTSPESKPKPVKAWKPRTPGPDPSPLLAITIATIGIVDFVIPLLLWASLPLTAMLTVLVVPWAVLSVRDALEAVDNRGRASGRLAFHFGNIALALAFLAAKWLTLVDALTDTSTAASLAPYRNYTAALVVLLVVGAIVRGGRLSRIIAVNADHPARVMIASFGLTSVVGAALLALPVSLRDPSQASLVDSFFVAMSAVCVTGLSPVNIAETYTIAGQAVICGLVQIGGLGIMVITAAVTILAGRRLGVKGSAALAEAVESRSLRDVRRTVGMIVTYTIVIEAAGALLLYLQFDGKPLRGASSAEWAAVFHSVSAFCNAGFSIFRDGITPFVGSPGVCANLGALVFLGAIGFPVIHELLLRWTRGIIGQRAPRLTLHTRVTLATTALVFGGLTLAYLALENGASFAGLGIFERLNAAVFQAVSRTSGFNVVDVGHMRPASLVLTCFGMFVGGGAGSTAGGIKVTTLAVLFASFRGELRAQAVRLFDRSLSHAVVRRAMGVAFLSTLVVFVVVFVLLLIEKHEPLAIVFESVSAFSTTGSSTGITGKLSHPTKLVIAITMLVGRIGPLTAAVAFSARARPAHYQLPEERVMIG